MFTVTRIYLQPQRIFHNLRLSFTMEVVERHIHSKIGQSPDDLSKEVKVWCDKNKYKIEALELRNDMYVIRIKPTTSHQVPKAELPV